MGLLLFGLHLVYKLRNATSETHKEKVILCLAVAFELLTSILLYTVRHSFWNKLTNSDHLLVLYALRCQLTVTLTVALVFAPKVSCHWPRPELLVCLLSVPSRTTRKLTEIERPSTQLYEIGKSRPSLIFGPLAGGAASSSSNAASSAAGQRGAAPGGSARHRCHISCEIHDHHLNDATRLHQAMLSNSALEIGSINLADMDPDEIQVSAELAISVPVAGSGSGCVIAPQADNIQVLKKKKYMGAWRPSASGEPNLRPSGRAPSAG